MPSLKDLRCSVELRGTDTKLQEFGTTYHDGCVETFVAVPGSSQPFSIRLLSTDFIAPGLSMHVFIDGVYQCNRNRQHLKLRKPLDRKALIDFRVQQKEESHKDGTMIARDWTFEKLNTEMSNGATEKCPPDVLDNIGCIEVLVLRCAGSRITRPEAKADHGTKAPDMNMDGAGDEPDHSLGLDGHWSSFGGPLSEYDSALGRPAAGRGTPVQVSSTHFGPPPPLSPQLRLTNTLQNMGGTRYSGQSGRQGTPAPSTHWRSQQDTVTAHPPLTFQYGSGPIPRRSRATSAAAPPSSVKGGKAQGFDPGMLNSLLTQAVKDGAAEIQAEGSSLFGRSAERTHAPQDLPGAWPSSPFQQATQHHSLAASTGVPAGQNSVVSRPVGTQWGGSHWTSQPAASGVGSRTDWATPVTSFLPNAGSDTNAWGQGQQNGDSWDSDDSWEAKKQGRSQHSQVRERGRSKSRSAWSGATSRVGSPKFHSAHSRSQWGSRSRGSSKSRPRETVWESGTDKDGWTRIETTSDTDSLWSGKNTVRPSSSISAAVPGAVALPGSLASYSMRPQKASVWEDTSTMTIPQPPGFDRISAPEPFLVLPAIFQDPSAHTKDLMGAGLSTEDNHQGWSTADNKLKSWEDDLKTTANNWTTDAWPTDPTPEKQVKKQKEDDWKTTDTKPTSRKSRLSRYRQNRPPAAADPTPKSHWQFPPPASDKGKLLSDTYGATLPAERKYNISKKKATEKGVEHQVRAGKGKKYEHYVGRPDYVDSFEKPYAVFRFKYRSRSALKGLLDETIPDRPVVPIDTPITTSQDKTLVTKGQLKKVSQDALIDELLKLRTKLTEPSKKRMEDHDEKTEVLGMKRTTEWVEKHSRESDAKGKVEKNRDVWA